MRQIALTGNVASGKSEVARLWSDHGVVVLDADRLARQAVEPGTEGLREIERTFGREFISEDGRLDRRALGRRIFSDAEARRLLEAILHPRIADLRAAAVAEHEAAGASLVVSEIPLLFELGLESEFDRVVFVDAPQAHRRQRLLEARGLTADEADAVLAAQMPSEEKRPRADYVIENRDSLEALHSRALAVLAQVRRELDVSDTQASE